MARRKINSVEDIVELTAQVPWWAGVVAALLSCALFGVACLALPGAPALDTAMPGAVMPVLRGLTTAGLYLLPLLFLSVAAWSAWLHYKDR